MTVPPGYQEVAGLFIPVDMVPNVMAAVRSIYAVETAGMDDVSAVAQVTKAVIADLLERYAVWQGTVVMQAEVGALQDALATAQIRHRTAIEAARVAALTQASRLLGPEETP